MITGRQTRPMRRDLPVTVHKSVHKQALPRHQKAWLWVVPEVGMGDAIAGSGEG